MKILSIEFKEHPILGNLKLDFTDRDGKPVDTIILAGENGCGKTSILEELYDLYNLNNPNYKGSRITTKVLLDEKEIETLKAQNYNRTDIFTPTKIFLIEAQYSTRPKRINIVCQQGDNFVSLPSIPNIQNILSKFPVKRIFSTADINYSITSSLDSLQNMRQKSDRNLTQEINQLLVDIDASDSSDLKAWVSENIGKVPPEDKISPRIKRFSQAFSIMFEDLQFYKIDNINKTIIFKKQGKEIPISQLSSGEKQIIYRGAFFLKDINKNIGKVVLIDEPEISLHPNWQKKILDYYQKLFTNVTGEQHSQIFVATHSPFIIHNPNRHNDKVIVLQKDDSGNIIQLDKPEYYDCNSCKAVEDCFYIRDFSRGVSIVFLEGRTDEMYFNKAKQLYGHKNLDYIFQWVGHLKKNDNEEFTGKDSLNKVKLFILGNKNIFLNKIILIYDCDTNKKTERISENLIVKTLEKQKGQRYNAGIENLLVLPQDFNYDKYYKTNEKTGEYGEAKNIQEFKKMDLAKDICGSYTEAQQREILQKIGDVVKDIERELFGV